MAPSLLAVNDNLSEENRRQLVINAEVSLLTAELADLDKYRDYYNGEQALVYGSEKFTELFGTAFDEYRDNWCAVVVDAIADRLTLEGVLARVRERKGEGEREGGATLTSTPFGSLESRVQEIWDVLRDNDIDEQQSELHEGTLVEGRAAVVVWPDPDLRVRVDWNPAQLIRVRYSDDDWRKPEYAIKRWVTPNGEVRFTFYTESFIYKYREQAITPSQRRRPGVFGTAPDLPPTNALEPRRIPNEPWPLPNPLGVIPVVEFHNKRGSELKDVIPQQDAVNYLMIAALGSSNFSAIPQRVFFTGANDPVEGWENFPGRVWKIPPITDAEGRLHSGSMGEFSSSELTQYRGLVETQLQHTALTSKTPMRMFFQSDRGGRGDAPSGESLLVQDEPLLDKVENRQVRFGNSWWKVMRLVNRALQVNPETLLAPGSYIDLPHGEVLWQDPRAKYRSALLEDAVKMRAIDIPIDFVVRKLGLHPDELDLVMEMIEEERERDLEKMEKAMERGGEGEGGSDGGGNGEGNRSSNPSNSSNPQRSRGNRDLS